MKNFKINKENRGLNHSFFKSIKYVSLLFLCISFLWTGCELSRTVPLDDPLYRPQLLIHGMASPRSGAEVGIRYNEPLVEGKAEIPDLPRLEVYLLRDGTRYLEFEEDSSGKFIIPGEELLLEPQRDYALEVQDLENGKTYVSGNSQLPEYPDLQSVEAVVNMGKGYNLGLRIGQVEHSVEAIAIYPVLLDSMGQPAVRLSQWETQQVTPWNKIRSGVQYLNETKWVTKELLLLLYRGYLNDQGENVMSEKVDLYVSFLSPELTAFVRDLEESFYSGEDIFQAVRPMYSSFPNTPGVFGLYNEVVRKVEIQE